MLVVAMPLIAMPLDNTYTPFAGLPTCQYCHSWCCLRNVACTYKAFVFPSLFTSGANIRPSQDRPTPGWACSCWGTCRIGVLCCRMCQMNVPTWSMEWGGESCRRTCHYAWSMGGFSHVIVQLVMAVFTCNDKAEYGIQPVQGTAIWKSNYSHFQKCTELLERFFGRTLKLSKPEIVLMPNCNLHLNMAPHVSWDLKACIPALHYEHGFPVIKICAILNIKKSLVYSTLQLHHSYGVTHNIHAQKQQHRRNLSSIDLLFIRTLLDQQHTVYLDEIQQQLLQRCGVKVSIPTLTHTLHRLHFTHKNVLGKALEYNEHHHAIFMNCIADLVTDPNMLICGDEASKDEWTSNRHKGWSQRGTRYVQQRCFVWGKRFSILPILMLDGIIALNIIKGLVTSERFVKFLHKLVVSVFLLICHL